MYLMSTICTVRKNLTKGLDELGVTNPYQNNLEHVDSRRTN